MTYRGPERRRGVPDRRRHPWGWREGVLVAAAVVGVILAGWAIVLVQQAQDALALEVKARSADTERAIATGQLAVYLQCERNNEDVREGARITADVLRDLVVVVNDTAHPQVQRALPDAFVTAPRRLRRAVAALRPVRCDLVVPDGYAEFVRRGGRP